MPSNLLALRDAIVSAVTALVPYDDSGIAYQYFNDSAGRWFQDGAAFHRQFRFEWFYADQQMDQGPFGAGTGLAIEQHYFEMRMRENAADRGPSGTFDHLVQESMNIKRLINETQAWPNGVDFVNCKRVRKEKLPPPSENYDLVFEIFARTEET